ncbi:MAG: hypothetical protein RJA22_3211 [Verrucomicrobiota bacterium]|jgi:flagellar hook-associated protein 3 FlgL
MRVTANTFPNSLVDQLSKLATRQYRLQNQAATGQRIQLPEDDPTAVRRVLDLQAEGSAVVQYRRNVAALREHSQANYEVLRGLKSVSDRAGELATLADGTRSPEELRTYAAEVTQLIQRAVQVAQARHQGQSQLGGTRGDVPAFVLATDANGNVTSVTYQGNESVAASEVAEGTTVSTGLIGVNSSGNGPRGVITDARFGADFFNHLIALQNHLLAGDTAAIAATDRAALAADEENLLLHLGSNAALQGRLETSETLLLDRGESLEAQVSREADADLAQTLVRLTQTQDAYRAALESGGRILNISLMDFLR